MFGISGVELAIIAVFAFLVFGPDKLPGVIKNVTHIWNQIKGLRQQADQVIKAEVIEPLKDIEATVNPLAKEGQGAADMLASKLGIKPDKNEKKKEEASQKESADSADSSVAGVAAAATAAAANAAAAGASEAEAEEVTETPSKPKPKTESFAEKKAALERAHREKQQAEPSITESSITESSIIEPSITVSPTTDETAGE